MVNQDVPIRICHARYGWSWLPVRRPSCSSRLASNEPQAEAVVTTVGEALTENVATKADLTEVKTDLGRLEATLRAGIAALGAEVKTDLADLATGLYRQLWVMAAGIVGLTVSLTVSLVKLLL